MGSHPGADQSFQEIVTTDSFFFVGNSFIKISFIHRTIHSFKNMMQWFLIYVEL